MASWHDSQGLASAPVVTEVFDPPRYADMRRRSSGAVTASSSTGVEEEGYGTFCVPELGSGDSTVYLDALPHGNFGTHEFFSQVRSEVAWNSMMHKGGAVPRLVALQGTLHKESTNSNSMHEAADCDPPVYRHPVDEQPELRPWSPAVLRLKAAVELALGIPPEHAFNHCLIQLYRSGHDFIGEHADKTLDILRGSPIVNLSLGCSRVMILRTKPRDYEGAKQCQKLTLPHNSIMKLGWDTNIRYTHEIKQDKRMDSIKRDDELLFGGERISFTFRTIATFERHSLGLYGQGAICKTIDELVARSAHRGEGAERGLEEEHARLLVAFSEENKSAAFDWDTWYGSGFDILNFETVPVLADMTTTGDS